MSGVSEAYYFEEKKTIGSLQDFEGDHDEIIEVVKFGEVTPLTLDDKFTINSPFPTFQLSKKEVLAIIQGGMGLGISGGEMAGQVAEKGGCGTVTSVMFGAQGGEKNEDIFAAELKHALSIAGGNGMVGANIMHAAKEYKKLVVVALKNGAQFLAVGAGLPMDLAELSKDYPDVALLPIISSGRALRNILKKWKDSGRKPGAIIYENPLLAGGHEGAAREEIRDKSSQYLYRYGLAQVFDVLAKFSKDYENIPVIAAGGILPEDLLYVLNLTNSRGQRVAGVQIATPFLPTDAAGIPHNSKQEHVSANERFVEAHLKGHETALIQSTAGGMAGRALMNEFVLEEIEELRSLQNLTRENCEQCLDWKYCKFEKNKWCIKQRLLAAKNGEVEDGLLFSGRRPQHTCRTTVGAVIDRYTEFFELLKLNKSS